MADDKEHIIGQQNGAKEKGAGGEKETGNGTTHYGSHDSTLVHIPDVSKTDVNETNSGSKEKGTNPGKDDISPEKKKKFRNNRYATKKTAGQGLMGVSLLTSNTAQLKTTLDSGPESDYYYLILFLVILSLSLQVVDGVLLMIIGSRESKLDTDSSESTKKTEKLNDKSTLLIFIITMVNAALGTFTINPGDSEHSAPLDFANATLSSIFG